MDSEKFITENRPVSRLAIIPARGGSKRIPRKNIKSFCGKPMITHILNTARKSALFDKIHVSTEDHEIVSVVEKLGLKVDFLRPDSLSDDYTSLQQVIEFVATKYSDLGENFDEVWLLMACAPLIEYTDLISASKLFSKQKVPRKPVLAVAPYSAPVEWAFEFSDGCNLIPLHPSQQLLRSQDITSKYYDTGTFIIFPSEQVLRKSSTAKINKFIGYVLSKLKSIDIDTNEDWELAEFIFKSKGNE